jgi:hypothetical protein
MDGLEWLGLTLVALGLALLGRGHFELGRRVGRVEGLDAVAAVRYDIAEMEG